MARDGFQIALQQIEEDLLKMAAFVEDVIAKSIQAMTRSDNRLADTIISNDLVVDELREHIHEHVALTIEKWAPLGKALRRILAYLVIADELERMGDYGVHVARSAHAGFPSMPLELIGKMSDLAQQVRIQLRSGVAAFAQNDTDAARAVCLNDTAIDVAYKALYRELLKYMSENSEAVQETTQFLFTMHDLERIGDRVANICESIIYIETGKYEKLN